MAAEPETNQNNAHKERATMILCPCMHFKNERLLTQDCCVCCHENAEILRIPPFIEMAGTWVSPNNPVNIWFLLFRIISMLYVVYCAMFTFVLYCEDGYCWAYFMYLTQWTAMCTTIFTILNVMASSMVYRKSRLDPDIINQKTVFNSDSDRHIYRVYVIQEMFDQTCLILNFIVVVQYFTLVFNPSSFNGYPLKWKFATLQLHGATFILVLIDYIISAQRLYYKSAIWPILFATIYTIWTIIFEIFINENERGVPYLYAVYDWSDSNMPYVVYIISLIVGIGLNSFFAAIKNLILMYCSKLDKVSLKKNISNEMVPALPEQVVLL